MYFSFITLFNGFLWHHVAASAYSFYPLPQDPKGQDTAPGAIATAASNARQVVNGTEVDPPGRYEYMVSLQTENNFHFCGGSLIDSRWVLSAAHCSGIGKFVHIGRHELNGGDVFGSYEWIEIDFEIPHPDFSEWTLENDIMLIRLKEDSNYTPVKLSDGSEDTSSGTSVTTIGWGTTSYGGYASDVLLEATVGVVDNPDCAEAYGEGEIYDDMICAAGQGKDACQGDSGGPLIIKGNDVDEDVLVGAVSWGYGCADPEYPGVYSRVSENYDWIMENQQTFAPTISSSPTFTPTPCVGAASSIVSVEVKTDLYPHETSWELTSDGEIVGSIETLEYNNLNYVYSHDFCVSLSSCITFTIYDTYGDGIIEAGYYKVFVNGELKLDSETETRDFNYYDSEKIQQDGFRVPNFFSQIFALTGGIFN